MRQKPPVSPFLLFLFLTARLWFPSTATAAVTDACSVLTGADAEAALGEPVGPPKSEVRPSGAGQAPVCKFRSTQGSAMKAKTVSVSIRYGPDDLGNKMSAISENEKSAGYKNVHDVGGVGDGAVWGTTSMMGRTMGELTVRKGNSVMLVILIGGIQDEANALEHAKTLAAKVLPKI
ncbi:MAG: hypothetical protein WB992_00035 [Bryobacteraceae bacterium]